MTREEAVKFLTDISYDLGTVGIEYLTVKDGKKMREAIETLSTEPQKMGRWIPVSERLPEENKSVIASTKYSVFPEAKYTKEKVWEWNAEPDWDYWKKIGNVLAWMPLPERYKAGSEEA